MAEIKKKAGKNSDTCHSDNFFYHYVDTICMYGINCI